MSLAFGQAPRLQLEAPRSMFATMRLSSVSDNAMNRMLDVSPLSRAISRQFVGRQYQAESSMADIKRTPRGKDSFYCNLRSVSTDTKQVGARKLSRYHWEDGRRKQQPPAEEHPPGPPPGLSPRRRDLRPASLGRRLLRLLGRPANFRRRLHPAWPDGLASPGRRY